jgi:hypothetical protein
MSRRDRGLIVLCNGASCILYGKGGSLMAEGIMTFSTVNRKVKTAFWFHEFSDRLYKPPRASD